MSRVRFKILPTTQLLALPAHLGITKLMAFPTAKRKEGNTKSVGVNPFQWACCNGAYDNGPPGVFTIIMKQMVMPLNISKAVKRCVGVNIAIVGLWLGMLKNKQ
jgi:hypothetical protein